MGILSFNPLTSNIILRKVISSSRMDLSWHVAFCTLCAISFACSEHTETRHIQEPATGAYNTCKSQTIIDVRVCILKRCHSCLTMAYEIYYAFTTTSTWFEKLAFLVWFEFDLGFTAVAIQHAHSLDQRKRLYRNMICGVLAGVLFLRWLAKVYPDEREQITAYWTGIILQFPIGWLCLYSLWKNHDTSGHSLEMWYVPFLNMVTQRSLAEDLRVTRYLGCFTAYGVFFWRYLNVPQNWAYVGSTWSICTIVLTLIPETLYPFVYVWVFNTRKAKPE